MAEHSKITTFVDFSMSGCIKYYNIYQLFTQVKLGSNIAVKNVLQVYVTTNTIFYAIPTKKGENITWTNKCRMEYTCWCHQPYIYSWLKSDCSLTLGGGVLNCRNTIVHPLGICPMICFSLICLPVFISPSDKYPTHALLSIYFAFHHTWWQVIIEELLWQKHNIYIVCPIKKLTKI